MGRHQRQEINADDRALNRVTIRSDCAFCDGPLEDFLDLGTVALAGGFLSVPIATPEPKFQLRVAMCGTCGMAQLRDIVDPQLMFQDYFYQSSQVGSLKQHFERYARFIADTVLGTPESTVVEIGCNDGVLLKPLAEHGVRTLIGVDPATNVVSQIDDPRIHIYNTFFTETLAKTVRSEQGSADLILANNVFAHIPDIQDAIRGVAALLASDGLFMFEVHDFEKIVHKLQYDMIYHEHMYYYSVAAADKAFRAHGLHVVNVEKIATHGGSLRIYVAHEASPNRQRKPIVDQMIAGDNASGLTSIATLRRYGQEVEQTKIQLKQYIDELDRSGAVIDAYGASGRANTILQYCNLGGNRIRRIYDDAAAKWGHVTPGTHIPIWPSERMEENPPTHILVLAWPYLEPIKRKCEGFLKAGGKLIVPLPELQVIDR